MKRRSFLASIVAGVVAPFLSKGVQAEVFANTEEVELDDIHKVAEWLNEIKADRCEVKFEIAQECKNTRRIPLAWARDNEQEMIFSYDLCDWYPCDEENYWYERGKEVFHGKEDFNV